MYEQLSSTRPQIRAHWDNNNECDTVLYLKDLKPEQEDKYMF